MRDSLEWTTFPMKENLWKALLFWVVMAFTIVMVWWNTESLFLTVFASALLLGSLTSFYLPTTYVLDEQGAWRRRWFSRSGLPWARVRSLSDEKTGLFLSPFPHRSRLENFRGLWLPYRDNREQVVEFCRKSAVMTDTASKASTADSDK